MDTKVLNDFQKLIIGPKDLYNADKIYKATKGYNEHEFRQFIILLAVASSNFNSVLSDIRKLQLGSS